MMKFTPAPDDPNWEYIMVDGVSRCVMRNGGRLHIPTVMMRDHAMPASPAHSPAPYSPRAGTLSDARDMADVAYMRGVERLNAWRDADPNAPQGKTYSSLAAGERCTMPGATFAVRSANDSLTWYRRDLTYSEKLPNGGNPNPSCPAHDARTIGDAAALADAAYQRSVDNLNGWRNR